MKKYNHIASFFAMISGIGFFLYDSIFGNISSLYHGYPNHIITIVCHGILFIGGSYLFFKEKYSPIYKSNILITMLIILSHGSIFATNNIKNSTFIYFLVKPEFLQLTNSQIVNYTILLGYYFFFMILFRFIIIQFFVINARYHDTKNIKNQTMKIT